MISNQQAVSRDRQRTEEKKGESIVTTEAELPLLRLRELLNSDHKEQLIQTKGQQSSTAVPNMDEGGVPELPSVNGELNGVIVQNLLLGAVFVVGGLLLVSLDYLGPILAAVLHNVTSFIVIFNSARLVRFGENLSPYSGRVVDSAKPVPTVT